MIKPTKYKSISVSDVKNRIIVPLTAEQKVKAFQILQKLTQFIKAKHT